jgi:3-oxoacyl-[acyl-carrier-protein] synthase III
MPPESKLKLYVVDIPVTIASLGLIQLDTESEMSNEDWMNLIWLCLVRNRILINRRKKHKSLPSHKALTDILTTLLLHESTEVFEEAYDQLYQIIVDRLQKVNLDPIKIRGMTITEPNNLYVYHV